MSGADRAGRVISIIEIGRWGENEVGLLIATLLS